MAKLGEGLKFKYEPIWPQADTDMRFHYYETLEDGTQVLRIHTEKFKLISSIEELKEFAQTCKDKIIGFDTETTGLTYGRDQIVGFSLSADRWSGVYVPIRHRERLEVTKEVPKLNKDGNKIVSRAGKVSTKKEIIVTFQESEANLNPKEALDVLYEILLNAKLVLAHNSEFDLNVLKFEGYDVNKIKSFDTLILPYVYDPEATGLAGLKALEKRVLGRTVPEFKEVLGKKYENFGMVPPKDGYVYAVCDTSGVVGIYEEMYPKVRQLLKKFKNPLVINGVPYDVIARDNIMVKIFVDYYGHAKIPIDKERAIRYKEQLEERQKTIIREIYEYFDKGMFNLSPSSNEFKKVMASKNVFTGVKTDKNGDSWSKKAQDEMKRNLAKLKECITNWKSYDFKDGKLSKDGIGFAFAALLELYGKPYFKMKSTINNVTFKGLKGESIDLKMFWLTVKHMYVNEKEKLSILNKIQENNSLCKALNSYVDKLTQVDECIMHYRLKGTKSGRLSSGNGSKSEKSRNHYYIDLNAQNLTKPASAYYVAEECSMTNEESILGWKFTPVDKDYAMEHLEDLYVVEGQDPNITVRSCLKAPKGRYVVSLDYDAEELRVLSCISGDFTMFIDEKTGKISPETTDPHERTAVAIWGADNYDKGKRKKAKICLGEKTLVYTNNGLKHPNELVSEDTLMNEKGEPLTWAMTTEEGKLIEITYDNGIIEQYTPNHRVKVWNGSEVIWKEVQSLTNNDEVIQITGLFKNEKKNNKIVDYRWTYGDKHFKNSTTSFNIASNEFAYLGGLYLGDGYMQFRSTVNNPKKPSSVEYCVEPEALETVLSYMSLIGLKINTARTRGKNSKIHLLHASNIAWAQCIEEYFGHKENKGINTKLFELWDREQILYFIAGLIDSDGSSANGRLTFSTTSDNILAAMTTACSAVGIRTAVRDRRATYKGKRYPYKEVMLYDIPCLNDIPILVSRKKKTRGTTSTCYGNWIVTKDFAILEREKLRQKGANWKTPLYKTWQNVVGGRCKLTIGIIQKTEAFDPNIPINSRMNPLRVVKKEVKRGIVYVIQTSERLYCTPCTVSHNCNFLMSYGGGAFNLAQQLDIPLEEAEEIIEGYKKGLPELQNWKDEQIMKMYQNQGLVFSAFGRPRNFEGWIKTIVKNTDNYDNLIEKQMLEKASERVRMGVERRVVNHEVQSTCGDILRLVMINLYIKYFKHRDPHIDFLSTVHDEVNYTIDKDVTVQYVKELEELMTFDLLDPRLPIATSTDIGFTYGNMFPFVWKDESKTILIPKRVHHA